MSDKLFGDSVELFLKEGRTSLCLLQRRLGISYPQAIKLLNSMEAAGIVGPDRGVKSRLILITKEQWRSWSWSKNEPEVEEEFIPEEVEEEFIG